MAHPLNRKNRLKTPTQTRLKITRTCRYCRIEFIPQSQRDFFCCEAHKEAFFRQLPKAPNITIRRIKKQPETKSNTQLYQ